MFCLNEHVYNICSTCQSEGVGALEIGAMSACEPLSASWEENSDLLQEQKLSPLPSPQIQL